MSLSRLRLRVSAQAMRAGSLALGGSVISQATIAASSLLLTRMFTPEDFGRFAIFMAFSHVGAVIAAGRMDFAILVPGDPMHALSAARAGALVAMTLTLASVGVMAGAAISADAFPSLGVEILLAPVGAGAISLWSIAEKWSTRRGQFVVLARGDVLFASLMVLIQATAGMLEGTYAWLIAGFIFGRMASAFYAGRGLVSDLLNGGDWLSVGSVFQRYRRFTLLSVPSSLLSQLNAQLPTLLLFPLFGPTLVGHYSLARRVLGAPLTTVGRAVSQVFVHRVANVHGQPTEFRRLLLKAYAILACMIAPVAAVTLFVAEPAFGIAFGDEWRPAGAVAIALLPYIVLKFLVSPSSLIMQAMERQGALLVWTAGYTVVIVSGVAIANRFLGDATAVISAYAWASALMYSLFIFLSIPRGVRAKPT